MKAAAPEVIASIPLYARLQGEELQALAAVSRIRVYSRGEVLFEEGEPADDFHTIVRGRVKVFKLRPGGKELILTILGSGDPVGAVAVYMETSFPASAEALEDTVCLRVPREAFFELIDRNPALVCRLLLGMTQRLVELTSRLASLTACRVEGRGDGPASATLNPKPRDHPAECARSGSASEDRIGAASFRNLRRCRAIGSGTPSS